VHSLGINSGSPQGSAASRALRKKGRPFLGETPIFGKMPTFLENFGHFRMKKLCTFVLRFPLLLNRPVSLPSTRAAKNYGVGESWDVFTKRVLVEKHNNSGVMYENPGKRGMYRGHEIQGARPFHAHE